MTLTKLRKLINETSLLLDRACTLANLEYTMLPRALRLSREVEKDHRRMGKGFRGSYSVGVELAGQLMVTQRVVQALQSPPTRPMSWVHVDGIRADVITCYAIAESIDAFHKVGGKRPDTKLRHADLAIVLEKLLESGIDEIDYAEDIAC